MTIVAILERGDCRANVLDILEDAAMDGLLLQGSVESLSHAIGLRLGDEGEARGDAPELDLVEEVIGRVLRAGIHAQREAAPGIGAGGAETVAGLDRMDADAAGIEMIDRREHPDPSLIHGLDADAVGAPHLVRAVCLNRALVQRGAALAPTMGRQQGVLAHQAQHPGAGDAHAAQPPQPRPHLTMALAGKGRGVQVSADGSQEDDLRPTKGRLAVLLTTVSLSLFLAVGKRRSELTLLKNVKTAKIEEVRKSL